MASRIFRSYLALTQLLVAVVARAVSRGSVLLLAQVELSVVGLGKDLPQVVKRHEVGRAHPMPLAQQVGDKMSPMDLLAPVTSTSLMLTADFRTVV